MLEQWVQLQRLQRTQCFDGPKTDGIFSHVRYGSSGHPASNMSKRNLAWIVIVLVGALSTTAMLWSGFGSIHVVFTAAELQKRLNQKLPRTVLNVTIEDVALNASDNRLGLRIDIQTNVHHEAISAVVSARGVPRYDGHREAMYFDVDEIKVNQVAVAGKTIVDENAAPRSRLGAAVLPAAQRVVEAAVKTYFAEVPVYRLRNDVKGFVLKAALSDIKIDQNVLVVTFSLWNFSLVVFVFALPLLTVASFVYFLIRYPLWGAELMLDIATVNNVIEIPLVIAADLAAAVIERLNAKRRTEERHRKAPPPATPP
jgi:hypothetical protein